MIFYDLFSHSIVAFINGLTSFSHVKNIGNLTVAIGVLVSGHKLQVLFIIAGTHEGHISQEELHTYQSGTIHVYHIKD